LPSLEDPLPGRSERIPDWRGLLVGEKSPRPRDDAKCGRSLAWEWMNPYCMSLRGANASCRLISSAGQDPGPEAGTRSGRLGGTGSRLIGRRQMRERMMGIRRLSARNGRRSPSPQCGCDRPLSETHCPAGWGACLIGAGLLVGEKSPRPRDDAKCGRSLAWGWMNAYSMSLRGANASCRLISSAGQDPGPEAGTRSEHLGGTGSQLIKRRQGAGEDTGQREAERKKRKTFAEPAMQEMRSPSLGDPLPGQLGRMPDWRGIVGGREVPRTSGCREIGSGP